ncbi:MAG: translocation/assembly module TamB domain-containing protein [Bacteroidales bacterium]|nr:translocation/assembly module TamB domain-containing protein [Bacteroidales bacterium]
MYLQNSQVQTLISEYLTERSSRYLGTDISVSSVHYSFFKRLQVYDFYMEDQKGDTLIYSEVTKIRIKKFRPDIKDIQLKYIKLENALFMISTDSNRQNSMQFLVDSLKKDIAPEDKQVIIVESITATGSRFRMLDYQYIAKPGAIDFSDLQVNQLQVKIKDFLFKEDTTHMNIIQASGIESSGFVINDVNFKLDVGKTFITFSEGNLTTPLSQARFPVVDFKFTDARNFRYLYDSIDMHISSSESYLDFQDIAYFSPELGSLKGSIYLDGSIFGTFGDMTGENIYATYRDETVLDFDMVLRGLPSTDSLYMGFDVRKIRTSPDEFKELTNIQYSKFLEDTSSINQLDYLEFTGKFEGFNDNFKASVDAETNIGTIDLDLSLEPDTIEKYRFAAKIGTGDLDLGKILQKESLLGQADLVLNIDGYGSRDNFRSYVFGVIDTIEFYGYDYKQIELKGNLTNKEFDGSLLINDPNINLNFLGNINYEKDIKTADFTLNVSKIKPYFLNLKPNDPNFITSFQLITDLSGNNIDNMNGTIELLNLIYSSSGHYVHVDNILAFIENKSDTSSITLESDLADLQLSGKYRISNLPDVFSHLVNDHIELFAGTENLNYGPTSFRYNIDIKESEAFLDFFFPDLQIKNGGNLNGYFRTDDEGYFYLSEGRFDKIEYKGYQLDHLKLNAVSDSNIFSLRLSGDTLKTTGGFEIFSPEIQSSFSGNKNDLKLSWNNDTTHSYSGKIDISGTLLSDEKGNNPKFSLAINPSYFIHDSNRFDIPESHLVIDRSGIKIDSLIITGEDQYLFANGKYAQEGNDSLVVSLENINLNLINVLNQELLLDLDGRLSGSARIRTREGKPLLTADLIADDLVINDQPLGKTALQASWMKSEEKLYLSLVSNENDLNRIEIDGYYSPVDQQMLFNMGLQNLNISAFQPYLDAHIGQLEGLAEMNLQVNGTFNDPVINGTLKLNGVSALVRETQTNYFFNDSLRIMQNDIYFDEFEITDRFGSVMTINGSFSLYGFKEPYLDLALDANNFNFLSTSRTDNERFYGDIFASSLINLTGPLNQIVIEVVATTEKNTNLKLPLFNPEEVESSDFITFIEPEYYAVAEPDSQVQQNQQFKLDMELEVTSDARIQLIFDPNVGDIIEASGSGDLKIELQENGDVELYGDITVENGEYLFTLQNVINKKFRIKPGGTISWNGAPTEAIINLEAIYETKASPISLAPERSDEFKKRIPVYCLLSLQGDLNNPTITPSIELPTAEPEIRSIVETSIGTEEELMRQFISLLVINNFISTNEFGVTAVGQGAAVGAAGVTASELLSNQLSNWLSQISNDFDIGVNYRPGDNITGEEVEVALSTQIFNDRLIFSGNLDVLGEEVTVNQGGEASNIVGDFDVEFRVSDKISVKAFNRVNDDRVIRASLYTQGVGLVYRNEFNNLSELFNKKNQGNSNDQKDNGGTEDAALTEED